MSTANGGVVSLNLGQRFVGFGQEIRQKIVHAPKILAAVLALAGMPGMPARPRR